MSSPSELLQTKLAEMLQLLGHQAVVQVDESEVEDRFYLEVKITVDDPAELIGRHGSLIDSLATVANMFVPKGEKRYSVIIDVNGYRAEREEAIKHRTQRAIDEVVSSGESVSLEPMKPWERRIVHLVAQERTDIVTESQGEEPDRSVVIKPA